MNVKTLTAILFGILVAAMLCLVTGLILYFAVKVNALVTLVGLYMIFLGIVMGSLPAIGLIIILIVTLVKRKNNK